MRRGPRIFLIAALLLTGAGLGGLAAVNYWIDPLFTFAHEPPLTRIVLDDRKQKTHRVYFGEVPYNHVLIGSSRVNRIGDVRQGEDFVINLGMDQMWIGEFAPYLELAVERAVRPVDSVILGLDFETSAAAPVFENNAAAPASYIDPAKRPFYRWSNLLSWDALRFSIRDLRLALDPRVAERRNIRIRTHRDTEIREEFDLPHIGYYRDAYARYRPHPDYAGRLRALFARLPEQRHVGFAFPVTVPLHELLIEAELYPQYEDWLRASVQEFDEFWDFTGVNSITADPRAWQDENHIQPSYGRFILLRVLGIDDPGLPADFGVKLTTANIEAHLAEQRRRWAARGVAIPD